MPRDGTSLSESVVERRRNYDDLKVASRFIGLDQSTEGVAPRRRVVSRTGGGETGEYNGLQHTAVVDDD